MLVPVLLSGGVGSRLWPVSRESYPKQFLSLAAEQSMLQETLARLGGMETSSPVVVCNEDHRFIVAEQLRHQHIEPGAIILEPVGRNTAPAVAVAAICAMKSDNDAILLVLPADHIIQNAEVFREAVAEALPLAEQGRLVTFGIIPTSAETGYGYIRSGDKLADGGFDIDRFVEKPDAETAQQYLHSGDYYWNSGMFMLKASVYLQELQKFSPAILEASQRALQYAQGDLDFERLDTEIFAACPSDSIDYAVMEKTELGAVLPLDCGWSDVGAWSALWDVADKDQQGNVLKGDVLLDNSKNNYIHSDSRLVAVTGVENLVVIETSDAVLVANRDKVQDVKNLVTQLRELDRTEANIHSRVYRPWGFYESLIEGASFQVKRIVVNAGHKLSLQKHFKRAEHWVVVSGVAEVSRDQEVFSLVEGESTYIPLECKHRLANNTDQPLELIEVQSGSYLGEDDIERFDDDYGR